MYVIRVAIAIAIAIVAIVVAWWGPKEGLKHVTEP